MTLKELRSSRGKRLYRCVKRHSGGICPHPARAYAELIEPVVAQAFLDLTRSVRAISDATSGKDLIELQATLDLAERRLTQVMAPEVQDAARDTSASAVGPSPAARRSKNSCMMGAMSGSGASLRSSRWQYPTAGRVATGMPASMAAFLARSNPARFFLRSYCANRNQIPTCSSASGDFMSSGAFGA